MILMQLRRLWSGGLDSDLEAWSPTCTISHKPYSAYRIRRSSLQLERDQIHQDRAKACRATSFTRINIAQKKSQVYIHLGSKPLQTCAEQCKRHRRWPSETRQLYGPAWSALCSVCECTTPYPAVTVQWLVKPVRDGSSGMP